MPAKINDGLSNYQRHYRKTRLPRLDAETPEQREARLAKLREYHKKRPPTKYDPEKHAKRRDEKPDAYFEKGRRAHLWIRYGMTPEHYDEMLKKQGGVCAICHRPETRSSRGRVLSLVVDHDHETCEVRALLCHRCNSAIGYADDSPDRLRAAAEYLERFKCITSP